MNPKLNMQPTFGGFNLDDVLKNEEAKKLPQGLKPDAVSNAPVSSSTSLYIPGLEVEEAPPHSDKYVYPDDSLSRLRKDGWERHMRPSEAFGFLIDCLETLPTGKPNALYREMFMRKEWLGMGVERPSKHVWTLTMYLDPEGPIDDNAVGYCRTYRYEPLQLKYSSRQKIAIPESSVRKKGYIYLADCGDEFFQVMYGRSFSALPIEVQRELQKTTWKLREGEIRPIFRDKCVPRLLNSGITVDYARGVREVKP